MVQPAAGGGTRREDAVVIAALVVIGAGLLVPWAVRAGFAADDWAIAERVERVGLGGAIAEGASVVPGRPVLATLLPIPFAVLGTEAAIGHAILTVGLGVATAAAGYAVLRRLGFRWVDAGTASVLFLLFPWVSSVRLWLTASINQFAVLGILAGLVLSLRALTTVGKRSLALHGVALVLYVLSVLTYEIGAGVALLAGAIYVWHGPRRSALRRWGADVVVVGAVVAWSLAAGDKVDRSAGEIVESAQQFGRDAVRLAASSVVPVDRGRWIVVLAVGAVLLAAIVAALRQPATPRSAEIRRWSLRAAGAAVAAMAAWAPTLPAAYWSPLRPGLENRVNVLAALPLAVLVVAIGRLLGLVLAGADRRRAGAVFAAGAVAVSGAYVHRMGEEAEGWSRASTRREEVLERLDRALPTLPAGSRVYVAASPAMSAPGVVNFAFSYDLWAAVRTRRDAFSIDAHPILDRARFSCDGDGVRALSLRSPTYEGDIVRSIDPVSDYGRTWFVAADGAAVGVPDAASCPAALAAADVERGARSS